MKPITLAVCLFVVTGTAGIAHPSAVQAQAGCADCIDIGMYPCSACVWSAFIGFHDCSPTCYYGACETSWGDPDCISGGFGEQLFAIATGTYGTGSGPYLPTAETGQANGESSSEEGGAPASRWTIEELAWAQVKRNCRGYIVDRHYPAAERSKIVRESQRIVI